MWTTKTVWQGLWDLRCAPPSEYRTTLCTIDMHCATTNLHCAPWCTMGTYVHEKWRRPQYFSFFDGSQGTCKKHFLSVLGHFSQVGWQWTYTGIVHKHGRIEIYSISVVDNEHANQGSQRSFVPIRWCIRRFCMFVIKFFFMVYNMYNGVLSVSVILCAKVLLCLSGRNLGLSVKVNSQGQGSHWPRSNKSSK